MHATVVVQKVLRPSDSIFKTYCGYCTVCTYL